MKRIMYILLAGLAAAGLASCEKQEFKPSVSDIYSVEIEEDSLQTKASSNDIEQGSSKTFYATLKKSSDGGKTWAYVSHSNWQWTPPTNCSIKPNSQNNNDTKHGVTAGSVVIVGNSINTANLTVTAKSAPTGDISKKVAVTVTAQKRTVTFNFTPNTTEILSIMKNKFGTTYGCTGRASVSCPIEVTDGSGNALGSASFAAFYQYTSPSKLESIKSMSSATKDERVLSLQVKIEDGKKLIFKFKEAGKIYFPDNDNRTNQKISVSQGSSTSVSGYYAAYQIASVNSDLTINVTTPN